MLGAGVTQLNLVISTALASLLPSGSVSYLYYADRLNQLPLGVVGIAVGTAILPSLSRQVRLGDVPVRAATQNRGVELALLLTLPAAAALIVLARPILTVLFERGAFGPADAAATAAALAAYAAGLPAFVLVKVLTPGFFAHRDTATPVKVAVAAMAVNFVLTLVLDAVPRACRRGDRDLSRGWLDAGAGPVGSAAGTAISGSIGAHAAHICRGLRRRHSGWALVLVGVARAARPGARRPALLRLGALAALVAAGLVAFGALRSCLGVAIGASCEAVDAAGQPA